MVTRNPGAAYDYCAKEETRLEEPLSHGVPPPRLNVLGDKKAFNQRMIEIGAEKAVEEGHIRVTEYAKLKMNLDLYKACTVKLPGLDALDNEWIWGLPGIGKTKSVRDRYPDLYEKDKSKYWNGYVGEKVVLIDDVEKDEMFLLGLLKKIAQHKPFMAEDKFGQMRPARPEKIICTSNFHFNDIWSKEVDQLALNRRFNVHHIIGL